MRPSGDARQEARWREIVAQVEADGPCLLRQGALIGKRARGRIVWALRYRARHEGRPIHRSLYLGTDERGLLRERVCGLLDLYRQQGRWLRQLPALVRLAAKLGALGRRQATRA
jgi:hypothetical protein